MRFLRFRYIFPLLALLSLLLHAHIYPRELTGIHAWRQTETATVVRNLARGDGDLLHPKVLDLARRDRVFRMEVPLMQAAFATVCRIVPAPDYRVMRALTFLIGLLTVAGMYVLGSAVSGRQEVGVLAAWMFNWSPVFFYYTLNPLPDNAALCAAVWSLAMLMENRRYGQGWKLALSAVLLGAAAAMKLPYIIAGAAVVPLWWRAIRGKGEPRRDAWRMPLLYSCALLPAAMWYARVVPGWKGNGVAAGIFGTDKTVAEIMDFFTGHIISTGPELLLNYGSLPALVAGLVVSLRRKWRSRPEAAPILAFSVAALLYYIYELPLIELVHDYYLMPLLPPIFLLAAAGAWWMLRRRNALLRAIAWAGLAVIPATAFFRVDGRWNPHDLGFIPGYLTCKEELRGIIPPAARVITGPDPSRRIHLYYLDRTGWTFRDDWPREDSLRQWQREGARFLVTDSTTAARLQNFTGSRLPVFSTENLRVYALE